MCILSARAGSGALMANETPSRCRPSHMLLNRDGTLRLAYSGGLAQLVFGGSISYMKSINVPNQAIMAKYRRKRQAYRVKARKSAVSAWRLDACSATAADEISRVASNSYDNQGANVANVADADHLGGDNDSRKNRDALACPRGVWRRAEISSRATRPPTIKRRAWPGIVAARNCHFLHKLLSGPDVASGSLWHHRRCRDRHLQACGWHHLFLLTLPLSCQQLWPPLVSP